MKAVLRTAYIVACAVGLVSLSVPVTAHSSDFSFKRVGPPKNTTNRFIDIQVEPVEKEQPILSHEPDVAKRAAPSGGVIAAPSSTAAWFWDEVSPAISAASTDRLLTASQVLSKRSTEAALFAQRPERIRKILDDHGEDILKSGAGVQVSPALVLAVIAVESAGNSGAVSSAGAQGLMQLMPATAERFKVSDSTDPEQNIRGGTEYLDWLLREFGGDAVLALAGYNAGEGAVRRANGVPDYKETRNYVPKVIAAWQVARTFCITPPQDVSDGCIFAGLKVASR